MSIGEVVIAIILFIVAAIELILAIRHFMGRGFLLNNAYIYAPKKERETMDKRLYYRQSAIVFFLLSMVFLIIGLSVLIQNETLLLIEIPLMAATIVYAVVSSVRINKKSKK